MGVVSLISFINWENIRNVPQETYTWAANLDDMIRNNNCLTSNYSHSDSAK